MRTVASRTMARLGVLSEREFRWFFFGHVTSVLGTSMAPVALTFAVLGAGGNASQVGLVLMAQAVPLAAGVLAGGVVGDRLPRKVVMLTADLLRWASQSLLAVLLLMGSPSLGQLMALAAVLGLGSAFFIPAEQAIIPEVASAERLQDANALWSMAKSLGRTVGPALAGVLVATTGPALAIAVDAATYGVSAMFLSRLRVGQAARAVRSSVVSELRDGWREFRSRSWLWTTVAHIAAFNMLVLAPFMVLGAVVAETELGGATSWGTILASEGAGSICGGLVMLRFRPARPVLVATVGTFGFALPLALLALRAPTPAVAAGSFVAGTGLGVWAALWYTTLQRQTTPETLARVSSYAAFGAVAFHPLGYAIAGPLSTLLGVTTTLWLAAAWVVVTGCLLLAVPSVRHLTAADEAAA